MAIPCTQRGHQYQKYMHMYRTSTDKFYEAKRILKFKKFLALITLLFRANVAFAPWKMTKNS